MTHTTQQPWQRTQRDLLGRIDRVDPYAANWDEEGFLGSRPQYKEEGEVFYRSGDILFGYLGGQPNEAGIKAHYEFSLGSGIRKDTGRYFLLAETVCDDGRTFDAGPIGEYAGTGNGICAAYRSYGAGRAFFKELMRRDIWQPEELGYSPGGLAAVKSAHKSLIHDVLADYPGLKHSHSATAHLRH
jgi:hypothetical protein